MIWFKCPGCKVIGTIDDDQLNGRVSIDCSECPYHETHNWAESDSVKENDTQIRVNFGTDQS